MAKNPKAPIPVFVFLDENVSCVKFEKLKNARVSSKYKLNIMPFPAVMDCLGIFDFQVVLFLKKVITSRHYSIRRTLFCHPRPVFIFITADRTFLSDAEKGFEIWKGNKKRKHQNKDIRFFYDSINPTKDAITIKSDNNFVVNISVRYVGGGKNDTQQVIINKVIKLLENFLI